MIDNEELLVWIVKEALKGYDVMSLPRDFYKLEGKKWLTSDFLFEGRNYRLKIIITPSKMIEVRFVSEPILMYLSSFHRQHESV